MAVTLTVPDLCQPKGELTDLLFPGGEFTALVSGWLVQAATVIPANTAIASSDHNAAATAWVYHRAYAYKVLLMMADPSESKIEDRSESFTDAQRNAFVALRDAKLADYNTYATPEAPVAAAFFGRVRASRRVVTC